MGSPNENIDYRKTDTFFPRLNRLFHPRQPARISRLEVKTDDHDIIVASAFDTAHLTSEGDKYIVENPVDVLDFIRAFYQKVNSPVYHNEGTQTKKDVDEVVNPLIDGFKKNINDDVTITTFTSANLAIAPNDIENTIPFLKTGDTIKIFKSLPNKTSFGLDGIPPVVMKHVPEKIVVAYTITFNNCLNRMYFPDR